VSINQPGETVASMAPDQHHVAIEIERLVACSRSNRSPCEQSGAYKVQANGQFVFSTQSIADRHTAAASAIQAAAKRVDDLTAEGEKLLRAQQEGWEKFTSGSEREFPNSFN
jgi:hypothetical protein